MSSQPRDLPPRKQDAIHRSVLAGLLGNALAEVHPLWEKYKQRAFRYRERGIHDAALERYRWMLEELRVSLFVQELKAAIPVSEERLRRQWEQIRF